MDESPESISQSFQRTLHIGSALADNLVAQGFTCLDEIAYVPFDELRKSCDLWEEEATALRNAARRHLMTEELNRWGGLDNGMPDA